MWVGCPLLHPTMRMWHETHGRRGAERGGENVLDYHLHLWPHEESDVALNLDQIAEYCAVASAAGIEEVALTEHLFRFTVARDRFAGSFDDQSPSPELAASMAAYFDHHARN